MSRIFESRKLSVLGWLAVLVLQIAVIVVIILIFKNVQPRIWAARWASFCFLVECLIILTYCFPLRVKAWSLSFPITLLFLTIFVLPMAGYRWFSDGQFVDLMWLGMNGQELHRYSEKFYYLLFSGTVLDLCWQLYGFFKIKKLVKKNL